MKLVSLAPGVGAAQMRADSSLVFFPLNTFETQFGVSRADLLAELVSGRLVAVCKKPDALDGTNPAAVLARHDVFVTARAVVEWLCHPDTPAHLKATLDNLTRLRRSIS